MFVIIHHKRMHVPKRRMISDEYIYLFFSLSKLMETKYISKAFAISNGSMFKCLRNYILPSLLRQILIAAYNEDTLEFFYSEQDAFGYFLACCLWSNFWNRLQHIFFRAFHNFFDSMPFYFLLENKMANN